ncbi:hypothetical protein ELG72_37855 [Rhizobium leguminosarum]|uniref:hypothetical protein n=1 Tax=Rhizobium leguminosarum TaxID=384 RepID=UPI00102F41C3|nr:hypothetical protein [Rhizobium leguminosarum]TBF87918.1 hypothetical protein ELG82_37670 [Rhizobium leguminosarum]TBG07101.1 hypothetical protein ELG80_37020 [Rhizobium leguminosarum]TBG07574.1 hypothetical protein ELG81_37755 [Rhizobium leguminosarum]TBG30785.1 hypothetical protein ELG75_36720 [Rhizobium leguminosarum]TBG50026.1 hypothetical protein ELG72_37855 [Rhizobium leguminosarum]
MREFIGIFLRNSSTSRPKCVNEGFRLAIGKSVHVYLKAVRLDAAVILLKEGMSVTEVAWQSASTTSAISAEHSANIKVSRPAVLTDKECSKVSPLDGKVVQELNSAHLSGRIDAMNLNQTGK